LSNAAASVAFHLFQLTLSQTLILQGLQQLLLLELLWLLCSGGVFGGRRAFSISSRMLQCEVTKGLHGGTC